ncbi:MAG: hypothetical protein LBQ65_10135 [Tannerellaceae bacterium]|jgi:hypothetical protein|nr:hypothetical protein [Tannerellaceae bacterium]
MHIDDLITKYFEGETTTEEERKLRRFFASKRVPQRLAIYRPIFAYFDEEIKKKGASATRTSSHTGRRFYYLATAAAAAVLLLLGIRQVYVAISAEDPCLCSPNYVVINGRCYTDMQQARALAFEALREVATPAGEYFPGSALFDDEE